jgi:hypothetical protein
MAYFLSWPVQELLKKARVRCAIANSKIIAKTFNIFIRGRYLYQWYHYNHNAKRHENVIRGIANLVECLVLWFIRNSLTFLRKQSKDDGKALLWNLRIKISIWKSTKSTNYFYDAGAGCTKAGVTRNSWLAKYLTIVELPMRRRCAWMTLAHKFRNSTDNTCIYKVILFIHKFSNINSTIDQLNWHYTTDCERYNKPWIVDMEKSLEKRS